MPLSELHCPFEHFVPHRPGSKQWTQHTKRPRFRKVYPSRRHKTFIGKYKDPWSRTWKNKALPVSLQEPDAAEQWFRSWLATTLQQGGVGQENHAVVVPAPTIAGLLDRWQPHRLSLGHDKKEVASTVNCIKKWGAAINDIPLPDLTVPRVAAWITSLQTTSGLAALTVRNVLQAFRGLVVDARGYGTVSLPENVFIDPFIKKIIRLLPCPGPARTSSSP